MVNMKSTTKKKTYTLGEIFKLGLLKNKDGLPFAHKGTVAKVIQGKLQHKKVSTRWGMGYEVSVEEINRFNKLNV